MSNVKFIDILEIMDEPVLFSLFVNTSLIYHGDKKSFPKANFVGLDKLLISKLIPSFEEKEKRIIPCNLFYVEAKLEFLVGN